MLTSLIEEYRFNKNTLSKYLEITEETIDGVVMGNVECLLDDPALILNAKKSIQIIEVANSRKKYHGWPEHHLVLFPPIFHKSLYIIFEYRV